MVLLACTPSAQVDEPVEGPSLELSAIDSLMWRQPDSALAQLQAFCNSPEADSLDEFNGHYCQLLISELLYKNYAAQSNREELLQAVAYFDSLVREAPHPPLKGGAQRAGDSKKISNLTPNLVFLAARAHYINGVGYYERDSVVEACAEYLKALEMMEEKLDKKSPKGKDAVFMFYTYNRLLSLFSTQFMMDPAIYCCEQALACCQNEPSLSKEIPNTYYHMGKQYDKKGEKDIARYYYGMTIEGLSDINNPVYRDAMSTKALCDYQVGLGVDFPLTTIRQMLSHANSKKEKLTRYFTIGVIFTIEQSIDSALFYLEPIFENKDNISLQTQAAEYLLINYDNTENKEKAEECMRFLSDHKKSEGETKAFVSKLEAMFKNYINQKQKKEAEEAREKAVRKAMNIIIPVAIGVVLVIIVLAKLGNKTLLKKKQEEADRKLGETERQHREELEAERQTHRMQQAALSGRLKRSNEELRELRDQKRQQTGNGVPKQETQVVSFDEEPICRLIMERVNEGQFKSKIDHIIYKDSALNKQQLLDLRLAVDRHFGQFTLRLRKAYPKLTSIDIDYCCLYLLNLTHADVSALMQRAYNTVVRRDSKIQKILGSEKPISVILMDLAHNHSSV